jgi:hypothetical protein
MGRSSKFIASKARFPSWRAWAVASIFLCPAFAGAGDARAQHVLPQPPIHFSPPPLPITIPSAVNTIPNLSATITRNASKQSLINSRPEGAVGPKGGAFGAKEVFRAPSNTGGIAGTGTLRTGNPNPGEIAGTVSKTPSGDTLGGAPVGGGPRVPRAYAPVSDGSATNCVKTNSDHSAASIMGSRLQDSCITVCGRYPYPPCH